MSDVITPATAPVAESTPSTPAESPVSQDTAAQGAADAQATLEDPNATPAEKKEAASTLRKYKIKVDGKQEEIELDLSKEDEIVKHLQLSKAAQKAMQERAELVKKYDLTQQQASQLLTILKSEPGRVLAQLGVDVKKFAIDVINKEIEEEQKTPEQKAQEATQKELEQLREEKKRIEEDKKRIEFERLQEKAAQQYDLEISSAIQESGLPKKPYVMKKFADLMMTALENNVEVSAKDLIPLVKKQIMEDIQEMAGAAPESVIEDLLGKEVVNKLRNKPLPKKVPSAADIKPTAVKPEPPKDLPKMSAKEFFRKLGR